MRHIFITSYRDAKQSKTDKKYGSKYWIGIRVITFRTMRQYVRGRRNVCVCVHECGTIPRQAGHNKCRLSIERRLRTMLCVAWFTSNFRPHTNCKGSCQFVLTMRTFVKFFSNSFFVTNENRNPVLTVKSWQQTYSGYITTSLLSFMSKPRKLMFYQMLKAWNRKSIVQRVNVPERDNMTSKWEKLHTMSVAHFICIDKMNELRIVWQPDANFLHCAYFISVSFTFALGIRERDDDDDDDEKIYVRKLLELYVKCIKWHAIFHIKPYSLRYL